MAATEHGLANGHEIRDRMITIAYELDKLSCCIAENAVGKYTSWRLFAMRACNLSVPQLVQLTAILTTDSAWLSFTPRASRRWASRPSCEITSLSSCPKRVSDGGPISNAK